MKVLKKYPIPRLPSYESFKKDPISRARLV
jgi:hypothetical protein